MGTTGIIILSVLVAVVDGECHCKTSCATFPDAPCTSVGDDDPCERGWFGPYCQMQNIALDRPTNQSSTYTNVNGTYPSSLAVDGRATNYFETQPFTCTHTENEPNPTWTVYLGDRVSVRRMRLYLRNSTNNPRRNDGLKIMVGNQECHQWYRRPPVTADVTCGETLQGNRVSISVRSLVLTLCEVQIFSCGACWFGDVCDEQCNCLYDEVCDELSGHCPRGCAAGFRGTDCLTPCDDHRFGVNCISVCGNCLNNAVCEKTTGRCPTGCEPGWTGLACLQPCNDGHYGDSCSLTCGHCHNSTVCNKTTGHCPQGLCQGKYAAPLCQDYNTDVCVPLAVTVTPYIIIVVIVVVAGVLFVVRKKQNKTSDPEPRYAGFEPRPEADYTELSSRARYDSPDANVYQNEEKQAEDDHDYVYPTDDNNR